MNTLTLNNALDKFTTLVPTAELAKLSLRRSSFDDSLIEGASTWRFQLPDRVRTIFNPDLSHISAEQLARITFRIFETNNKRCPILPIIVLDGNQCFMPALITSPFSSSLIALWARVSPIDLLCQLKELSEGKLGDSFYAIVSNLLVFNSNRCGLYSQVALSAHKELPLMEIVATDDSLSQYPGLAELIEQFKSNPDFPLEALAGESAHDDADIENILRFERYIQYGEYADATNLLEEFGLQWSHSARAQFAAGILYTRKNNHTQASSAFHKAQLLDHPDALEQEWNSISRLTKPFRQLHADIFEQIQRGDRLRTLTKLRQVVDEQPLVGNAVLAYCLRGAGVSAEGLEACEKTLALNPTQSDVLDCKWHYLTELERDEEAFHAAIDHLDRYPQDNNSLTNLIDSSLLLGQHELAMALTERYSILSTNIERTCYYLFRAFEQNSAWRSLIAHYERVLAFYPNPGAETLALIAEALIEVEQFERAFEFFERAMALEPINGKIVTGFARGLARFDKEAEAEALLRTALSNHRDPEKFEDKAFIVTSLAEISRRTGRSAESIEIIREQLPGDLVELSIKVGPFPALEYVESLLELHQLAEAEDVMLRLKKHWPEDPHVEELCGIVTQAK